MSEFASLPPSEVRPVPEGYIQGGLMKTGEPDFTSLLIFDLRNLGLNAKQGKALEGELRKFVHQHLTKMDVNLKNRSAIDLAKSVFGIAFE